MSVTGLFRPARSLLEWDDNPLELNLWYILFCVLLVLFAGCMSGLTLGLLQLDIVDLEVLRRSGTAQERRCAQNIMPIVKNAHYLLVTLLLCNAAAMETLPIFLDKMVHESVAIIVSVTAVLLFGEIIPQAVCSKHGLMIGSLMALPVRCLMVLTSPISWPLSKLLDRVLGGDHASLFRRKQLKALVHIHSKHEGFGGKLNTDEIQVITGALDLTTKVALHAMTPLPKVMMLSTRQILDDQTLDDIMGEKPYSRLPVYRDNDRTDIVGLVLVKELLKHVKKFPDAPVSSLKIRPIPRLSALTPMYTLLKLFRSGKAHMAVLTQPPNCEPLTPGTNTPSAGGQRGKAGAAAVGGSQGTPGGSSLAPSSMATPTNSARGETRALLGQGRGAGGRNAGPAYEALNSRQSDAPQLAARRSPRKPLRGGAGPSLLSPRQAGPLQYRPGQGGEAGGGPGAAAPLSQAGGKAGGGLQAQTGGGGSSFALEGGQRSPSSGGDSASSLMARATASNCHAGAQHAGAPGGGDRRAEGRGGGDVEAGEGGGEDRPLLVAAEALRSLGRPASALETAAGPRNGSGGLLNMGSAGGRLGDTWGTPEPGRQQNNGRTVSCPAYYPFRQSPYKQGEEDEDEEEDEEIEVDEEDEEGLGGTRVHAPLAGCGALPGEPIGIITIEDVIEELMQSEIVDETDVYIDNEQLLPVSELNCSLPHTLQAVMTMAEAAKACALAGMRTGPTVYPRPYGGLGTSYYHDASSQADASLMADAWQSIAHAGAQATVEPSWPTGVYPNLNSNPLGAAQDGLDSQQGGDRVPRVSQGSRHGGLAGVLAYMLHPLSGAPGGAVGASSPRGRQDGPEARGKPQRPGEAREPPGAGTAAGLLRRASSVGLGWRGGREPYGGGVGAELMPLSSLPLDPLGQGDGGDRSAHGHGLYGVHGGRDAGDRSWRGGRFAGRATGGLTAGGAETAPLLDDGADGQSGWAGEDGLGQQAGSRRAPWTLLFGRRLTGQPAGAPPASPRRQEPAQAMSQESNAQAAGLAHFNPQAWPSSRPRVTP